MIIFRILYALRQGFRYRFELRQFLHDNHKHVSSVIQFDLQQSRAQGVQGIILDFDGVLAAHAEPKPREEVCLWLNQCIEIFSSQRVFILSNKPTPTREQYFLKEYPGVRFIIANRKKPYPDGINKIVQQSGLEPQALLLLDDRLGTGILATLISGIRGCLVTQPYQNFQHRPIRESFFQGLRWLDRKLVSG